MSQLLALLSDPTYAALATLAATLLSAYLHSRGYNLPIINGLLDIIIHKPQPVPDPAKPGTHPVLDSLLATLQKLLPAGTQVTGFSLPTVAGDASAVSVTLHTAPESAVVASK